MVKIFRCMDVVEGCDFRVIGETSEEVLQRAAAHAKNEHDVNVTAEFVEKARNAIHDR